MGNILQSLPAGDNVGIAFSRRLDTIAAIYWMRQKGDSILRYGEPSASRMSPTRTRSPGALQCGVALAQWLMKYFGPAACGGTLRRTIEIKPDLTEGQRDTQTAQRCPCGSIRFPAKPPDCKGAE